MNQVTEAVKPSREAIEKLQEELTKLPQVRLQTQHLFCDGMYSRTILIPKGTTLVGAEHKREHLFIIISGDLAVMTETGMARFKGPTILKSLQGIKRAGYAFEDTIVTTIHQVSSENLEEVEKELCVPEGTGKYLE